MPRSLLALAALFGLLAGRSDQFAVADGFDYPIGKPDGTGYRRDLRFSETCTACGRGGRDLVGHLGEDWNRGSGDSDLGDPVYAVAHGTIVYAQNAGPGWGNVVIIRHRLPDGREVASLYGHLENVRRASGSVSRGEQIGTIGRGYDYGDRFDYSAHLHFEIRTDASLGVRRGYSTNNAGWTAPSDFIEANRRLETETAFAFTGTARGFGLDGARCAGSYTFDSGAADTNPDPNVGVYRMSAPFGFEVSIGGQRIIGPTAGLTIRVRNNVGGAEDDYEVTPEQPGGSDLHLIVRTRDLGAFTSDALPTTPPWGRGFWGVFEGDHVGRSYVCEIDSLTGSD